MILWTLVLVFETTWLPTSADVTNSTLVALIQSKHQKYCGRYNCITGNKTAEFSDDLPGRPYRFKTKSCPPCYECSCRWDCVIFGDCCPDLHIGPPLYSFQCLGVPFKTDYLVKYFVVTDCSPESENYSRDLADRCHSSQLDSLGERLVTARVTSAGVDANVTFMNRFCAECKGITSSVPWNILVECNDVPQPKEIASLKDFLSWANRFCWIGFVPPGQFNDQIRKCKVLESEIQSTCDETGYWHTYNTSIAEACSAYYNPLRTGKFRNIFCFLCNGFPEDSLTFPVKCEDFGLSWGIKAFSAILNFEATPEVEAASDRCKEEEYEDTMSNKCRRMLCPSLHQLRGGNCTSFLYSAHGIVFKLKIVLVPLVPLQISPILSNKTLINYMIRRIRDQRNLATLNMTVVSYVYDETKVKGNYEQEKQNDSSLANGIPLDPQDPGAASNNVTSTTQRTSVRSVKGVEVVAYVDVTALVTEPRITTRLISQLMDSLLAIQYEPVGILNEGRIVVFKSIPSIYFSPKAFNISGERLKSVLTDRFLGATSRKPASSIFLEIPSPHLYCPQVEFQENEYKRAPNGSLIIIPDSLHVCEPNYEITDSLKLRVCVDYLRQMWLNNATLSDNTTHYNFSSTDSSTYTMKILTSVCLGISLICLLICFITHCLFAEMRTLPGINLMFLTFSLFVSQTLYLFGAGATDDRVVCTVMGILIHYSWLVTFAWMNVCSFHVFRVFRNVFSALTLNDNKKIIVLEYALFSYIVPGTIVALHILVNYFSLGESSLGYNDDMTICFIKPGFVSIPSFAIPAGLTVLLSTAFFIFTCVVLHKTSKERSMVGIKESVPVFRFFKLASITGLSWLFGFLGAILKKEVLAYMFIILAGGQGLFVFLSFSFSRDICVKYASCLCCARKKKQSLSEIRSTALENISTDHTMRSEIKPPSSATIFQDVRIDSRRKSCPPCYECSCRWDCVIFGDCCPDLHIGPPLYSFQCLGVPFKTDYLVKYFVVTDCSPESENYSRDLADRVSQFSTRFSWRTVEDSLTFPVKCEDFGLSWGIKAFSAILNFEATPEVEAASDRCKEEEYEDTMSVRINAEECCAHHCTN
ncbi:uncharacterized protein LOC121370132 [Gigantopelta aegis]|uniref:uncharacterized protein LOC121370132 n=1 Tax=Gigantopelta aegis TaxID=1735272 RepID=UPI001B88B534|nr:uncharacterized protein LOC121370132 [Gigantopelta aegis]